MTYTIILIVILFLGLFAFREWFSSKTVPKKTIEELQNKVSQIIALGDWESASKELKFLQDRKVGGLKTDLLQIQILRGTDRQLEALEAIDNALLNYPNHLTLHKERGKLLLEQNKAEEALEILKQTEPIFRDEQDFLDLATAYFQTNQTKLAFKQLQPLLTDTKNGRVLALAGDCYFQWSQYDQSVAHYQKAQETGWNNYHVLSRLAHCYLYTKKLDEAEYLFCKILEKDPYDISSTLGYGTCLEAKGNYKQALRVYQDGKAWNQGDATVLRQAGICTVYIEQYHFAEIYLTEALKRGAQSPQAVAFLGFSLEKQQRWPEAEKIYLKLVTDYPNHVAGYRALAWLYGVGLSTTLTREDGLKMAHQALTLLPEPASWEVLSACEARAGNFDTAHNIQERLSTHSDDEITKVRRRRAMRTLRKKIPLDENQVNRALVA